jgi:hypothetical protein
MRRPSLTCLRNKSWLSLPFFPYVATKTNTVALEHEGSPPCSKPRHQSLSWASLIHSIALPPQQISLISIMSQSTPRSSEWSLSFELSQQYAVQFSFLSSPMHATCLAYLIVPELICLMIFGEEYYLWSFSLCNFLNYPVTSSFLGANILLRYLFSNSLTQCSSLNVRDQVSHPYKTICRIIVL